MMEQRIINVRFDFQLKPRTEKEEERIARFLHAMYYAIRESSPSVANSGYSNDGAATCVKFWQERP